MKVVVLLLILIYDSEAHIICDNPISNISLTMVTRTPHQNSRMKRAAQNLRISMYYTSSFTTLSNKDDIIRLIITPVIQFWQDALFVKNPLTSPLLIDRACPLGYYIVGNNKVCDSYCGTSKCYTTPIPSQYMKKCYTGNSVSYTESGIDGSGAENTDLLLMVTQISTSCSGSTLAYATNCELEHGHDRPVLGIINICPGMINTVTGVREAIAILKHEIAHVLGIAANLFAFYRDECDNPRTTRDTNGFPNLGFKSIGTARIYQYSDSTVLDTVKTYGYRTGKFSKDVSFIVTSTVRDEIRKYFNCASLEGMALEDYGSAGSTLSHFEKLYFQNELMTSTISDWPRISRLTMAVLQDTGWYNVNFDKAEYFDYGKNLGCDFVTQSCYDFMKSRLASSTSILPYCNTVRQSTFECSSDQKDVAYCDLYSNSAYAATVPGQFKYFFDSNLISSNGFSDYCPVMMTTVCNKNNLNIDPQCNNVDRPCTGVPIYTGTCPPKPTTESTITSTSTSIIKSASLSIRECKITMLLCFIIIHSH